MIDLHAHILPGIDDGPPDMAGSLALARAAVDAGTRVMVATPHVGLQYPVVPGEIAGRVAELSAELERAGIPLQVLPGGELAPPHALDMSDDELAAIALGGSRCILLECPFTRAGDLMPSVIDYLQAKGFRVLIAHPERSPDFIGRPKRVAALVERGVFVQVTSGALDGSFGRTVFKAAAALFKHRLVHVVASDVHDHEARPPVLREVVESSGASQGEVRWLVELAPRALLDDAELPAVP